MAPQRIDASCRWRLSSCGKETFVNVSFTNTAVEILIENETQLFVVHTYDMPLIKRALPRLQVALTSPTSAPVTLRLVANDTSGCFLIGTREVIHAGPGGITFERRAVHVHGSHTTLMTLDKGMARQFLDVFPHIFNYFQLLEIHSLPLFHLIEVIVEHVQERHAAGTWATHLSSLETHLEVLRRVEIYSKPFDLYGRFKLKNPAYIQYDYPSLFKVALAQKTSILLKLGLLE